VAGKDKQKTAQCAESLGEICHALQSQNRTYRDSVKRLGPVAAPLSRLQKQYRWHILLKGTKPEPLHGLSRGLMEKAGRISSRAGVRVIVDVDPVDML
jgi:primosomal protein N' (replication factor Y)